jgi:hypothetical protein
LAAAFASGVGPTGCLSASGGTATAADSGSSRASGQRGIDGSGDGKTGGIDAGYREFGARATEGANARGRPAAVKASEDDPLAEPLA